MDEVDLDLMHKLTVASLLLIVTLLSFAPIDHAAAQTPLPPTLDLDGAPLRFDAVGQTVEPSSLIEAPMSVGETLTYRDVATVDGFTVDAVITVVSVENLLGGQAEYTDENNANPELDGAIEADVNAGPSTPGRVIYRMAFFHGGTYTGAGTGVPVTLLRLRMHVYDVDNLQFVEFSGFAGYQLSTNTIVTVTAGSSGRTRFAETTDTSTSTGSSRTAYTRGRVTVRFDAVSSYEYAYGVIEPEDGASYSIDLSADGQAWTDNVGGAAAAEVANPTLTLSSVGPVTAPTSGGEVVTLRGAGFVPGTTVRFGSAACTDVVIVSATELTCRAPAGTGTVDVTVTNPDASTAVLPAAFSYVVVPTTTTVPAPTTAPTPTTTPAPTTVPTGGGTTPATTAPMSSVDPNRAAAPATLAFTGSDRTALAVGGLLAVALGSLLVSTTRKRPTTAASAGDQAA